MPFVHRIVKLAGFALVVRLIIDLATPSLPGAFLLHADGLYGVTAAQNAAITPGSGRAGVPSDARTNTIVTPMPSPPAVVPSAPPRRRVLHPLRLPAESSPASADLSADH